MRIATVKFLLETAYLEFAAVICSNPAANGSVGQWKCYRFRKCVPNVARYSNSKYQFNRDGYTCIYMT